MYQLFNINPMISEDAITRYLEFLDNYPSLVNHVALSHITSYLGVTPQSWVVPLRKMYHRHSHYTYPTAYEQHCIIGEQ